MAWHRRDEGENPAWPGLVDIFAFTLIFVMLIWLASDLPKKVANLKAEKLSLGSRISRLSTENQSLNARIERLTAANQDLQDKTTSLEASTRELDAANKKLAASNLGLNSQIVQLGQENALLRDIGRRDFQELLQLLRQRLAGLQLAIIPHERDKEIEIQGRPRITFATMSYDLAGVDQERLRRMAPILAELRQQKKFFVAINGTADPRELHQGAPPRNNTELSALRAATVARVLEEAAPGLGRYLRVVGLGVKGPKQSPGAQDNADAAYREYRSVNLVVKMDLAAIAQAQKPG